MYIKRNLETIIEKFIDSPEIIAITGVRQSGKTTLMQHIAAKLEKSFYFSFEDIEAKDLFDNSVNCDRFLRRAADCRRPHRIWKP